MKQPKSVRTLELLLRALTELYPLDKTRPGIVLSYLDDKEMFYGSIARYDGMASVNHPPDRQILATVQAATMADVLYELAAIWLQRTPMSQQLLATNQPRRKNNGKEKGRNKPQARRPKLRGAKKPGGRNGKEKR